MEALSDCNAVRNYHAMELLNMPNPKSVQGGLDNGNSPNPAAIAYLSYLDVLKTIASYSLNLFCNIIYRFVIIYRFRSKISDPEE